MIYVSKSQIDASILRRNIGRVNSHIYLRNCVSVHTSGINIVLPNNHFTENSACNDSSSKFVCFRGEEIAGWFYGCCHYIMNFVKWEVKTYSRQFISVVQWIMRMLL